MKTFEHGFHKFIWIHPFHLIETWWRIEMKHLSEAGAKLSASHAVDQEIHTEFINELYCECDFP